MKYKSVSLQPYSIQWAQDAFELKQVFKNIFDDRALSIEHIGATAVKGSVAKPIIDLAVVVKNQSDFKTCERKLKELGYELSRQPTEEENGFFSCKDFVIKQAKREKIEKLFLIPHQITIAMNGSDCLTNALNLVHLLNGDSSLLDQMNREKLTIFLRHENDPYSYDLEKRKFFNKFITKISIPLKAS